MSHDGHAPGVFLCRAGAVEVTPLPRLWRVTVGERTLERRRLDEALFELLGRSRYVLRLEIEILNWAYTVRARATQHEPSSSGR